MFICSLDLVVDHTRTDSKHSVKQEYSTPNLAMLETPITEVIHSNGDSPARALSTLPVGGPEETPLAGYHAAPAELGHRRYSPYNLRIRNREAVVQRIQEQARAIGRSIVMPLVAVGQCLPPPFCQGCPWTTPF